MVVQSDNLQVKDFKIKDEFEKLKFKISCISIGETTIDLSKEAEI